MLLFAAVSLFVVRVYNSQQPTIFARKRENTKTHEKLKNGFLEVSNKYGGMLEARNERGTPGAAPLFSVNYLAFRQGTKRGEVARSSSTMRRAAGTGPPNNSPGAAGYGAPNRGVGSMEGGGSSPMDPEMGSSYGAGTAGSLKRVRLKLLVA